MSIILNGLNGCLWGSICYDPVSIAAAGTAISAIAAGGGVAMQAKSAKDAAKRTAATPAPAAKPAEPMPDREDPKIREERERKLRERAMAGGRESTNLSPGSTGGDYTNTVLGG